MFSPRTHRRQNSAETSYQKGKSPYYPSFPLFPFFLSTAVTGGGGAAIFSLQHALTTRNGLDKVVQFVFASAAHAKGNDLPSTMNRSRNTYSRISRMNDFIPNFRNMLLLPTFCDESRFWIIVSGSERSRNSWLGRQLEAAATFGRGFSLLYERWDLSGAHLLANPRGLCAFVKGKGLHLCGRQRRIEGRERVRIDRDSSIFRGGQRIFLELRMFCRWNGMPVFYYWLSEKCLTFSRAWMNLKSREPLSAPF